MKYKIYIILGLLAIGACVTQEEVDPVDPVHIITGTISIDSNNVNGPQATITGRVLSAGDGLTEYGHVWSTVNTQPTLTDPRSSLSDPASIDPFASTISLEESGLPYFIRAYATDVHGRTTFGEDTVIRPPQCLDFEARFTYSFPNSAPNCTVPCQVTFTNQSDDCITGFLWDFGDGSTSEDKSPVHTYTSPGNFTITLKTFFDGQEKASSQQNVTLDAIRFTKFFSHVVGKRVIQHSNGDYYVVGELNDGAEKDIVLLRADTVTGSTANTFEEDFDITSTNDEAAGLTSFGNSMFFTGTTSNVARNRLDIFVMKADESNGAQEGTTKLVGQNNIDFQANNIIIADGNPLIIGSRTIQSTNSADIFLLKVKQDLSTLSALGINLPNNEYAYDIEPVGNNGFMIVGFISTPSANKSLVLRTDRAGTPVSPVKMLGNGVSLTFAIDPVPGSNDFVICGLEQNGGFQDIFLARISSTAALVSNFSFDPGGESDVAYDVEVLEDGSMLVVGQKGGSAFSQAYIAKISPSGTLEWDKSFGTANENLFRSIDRARDGGFIVTGAINGKMVVIKTNDQGETLP